MSWRAFLSHSVMPVPGLDPGISPGIHAFFCGGIFVDGRAKPGHDELNLAL